MKYSLVFIIPVIFSLAGYSQSAPERILGTFTFEKRVFNYEFTTISTSSYTFKISTIDPKAAPLGAEDEKDTTEAGEAKDPEYQFSTFSLEVFERIFKEQMVTVYGSDAADQKLRDKSHEVFYTIRTKSDFGDDEPVTAFLLLKRDSINSYLQSNGSNYYKGRLSLLIAKHYVSKVAVEIADGTIKNIKVHLIKPSAAKNFTETPNQYLEFKNQFPISISGKFDAEKLADINLYSYNCNGEKGVTRYLRLSDLLVFDIVLDNNKEDYSPVNSTVFLTPGNPVVELKKEKRSKIIDVAAFTDFTGLDREEPNGLIQIEASRRLNLNTKYRLLFGNKRKERLLSMIDLNLVRPELKKTILTGEEAAKKQKYIIYDLYLKPDKNDTTVKGKTETALEPIKIRNRPFRSPYVNFAGSIEPRLLFSKLEENNRFIDSGKVVANKINPVQLYQYQLASFGFKMNLLKLSFPQLKLNINVLNAGIYWFRTRLSTSTDTANKSSIPLNSHYILFGTSFVFSPDSRWGIVMGCDYIRPGIWSPDYSLTSNTGLLQPYFDGHLKTNDESKLFFRFRWTHERLNKDNNFTQIQLGYTLALFTK